MSFALAWLAWVGLCAVPALATDIDPARKQRAIEQTLKSLNLTDSSVVEKASSANALLEVRFEEGTNQVMLVTEREPLVSVIALKDEDKVVVDFRDTVTLLEERSVTGPDGALVAKVRSSQFEIVTGLTARVVLDLAAPAEHEYEILPNGVVLRLHGPGVIVPVRPAADLDAFSTSASGSTSLDLKPLAGEESATEVSSKTDASSSATAETEAPSPVAETPAPETAIEEGVAKEDLKAEEPAIETSSEPPLTELVPGVGGEEGAAEEQDKLVTISFAKGTSLVEAINALARVGGLNVVIDPGVDGEVTARLVDVPLKTALRALLVVNGFDYIEKDKVYRVVPIEKTGLEDVETKVLIKKLEYVEVKGILATCKDFVTKEYGTIAADEKSNTIVVKDIPPVVDNIENLLQTVDKRTQQVYVEAAIVDVRVQEGSAFGFQWAGPSVNFGDWGTPGMYGATGIRDPSGLTGTPAMGVSQTLLDQNGTSLVAPDADSVRMLWTGVDPLTNSLRGVSGGSIPASLTSGGTLSAAVQILTDQFGVEVMLTAAETSSDIEVLAMPTILTLDNQVATVAVIEKLPYVEYRFDKDTGAISDLSYKTEDVKIQLEVTPHITADNQVLLKVKINKDEGAYEDFPILGGTTSRFPNVTERYVSTNTIIVDGNTLVMGGLRDTREQKDVSSIPFLGRLPLIGWLFRSEEISSRDYELIVFLTPHIIESEFVISERDQSLYETTTTHADNQTVDPYNRFNPYYDMKHRSQYVSPHSLKPTPGGKSMSVDGPAQWKYW